MEYSAMVAQLPLLLSLSNPQAGKDHEAWGSDGGLRITAIYTSVLHPPLSPSKANTKAMRHHGISFYCTLLFFALSIALLHWICCPHSPSLATVTLQGRMPRRLLSTYQTIRDQKSHVVEDENWSLMHHGGVERVELPRSSDIDDMDESVYHLDYHGVKTHPSPTPKIPIP